MRLNLNLLVLYTLYLLSSLILKALPNHTYTDSVLSDVKRYTYYDSTAMFVAGNEAIQSFKKLGQPVMEASVLMLYGKHFYYYSNYDRARHYNNLALQIARKYKNDTLENRAEVGLALIETEEGNLKKSIDLFEKIIKKAQKIHDTISLIEAYNSYAVLHDKKNYKEEVMANYMKALALSEKSNNKYHTAHLLNNLGILHFNAFRLEYAKRDFIRALTISEEIQDDRLTSLTSNDVGMLYSRLHQPDSAIFYYKKSLLFTDKSHDPLMRCRAFANLAYTYFGQKNYTASKLYADSALNTANKNHIKEIKPMIWMCLSDIELNYKNYTVASHYADSALYAITGSNSREDIAACYELKSDIYAAINDYKNAYRSHKLFKNYRDSAINIVSQKKIEELQIQYAVSQEKHKLSEEKHKVVILSKELDAKRVRQRVTLSFAGIGLFFILLIGYVGYIRNLKKVQEVFSQKQLKLIENERNRISKELHDSIGSSLAMIKNSLSNTHTSKQDIIPQVDEIIEHTRSISHQLYPSYLDKVEFKNVVLEFMKNVQNETQIRCFSDIENANFSTSAEDKNHILRIIQECVTNTIKHSQATSIHLSFQAYNKGIRMIYKDNGIGIDKNKIRHGIGIMSMRERAKIMNGDLVIKNNDGKGVKLIFTFFPTTV